MQNPSFMPYALAQAQLAVKAQEVPIGAVVVDSQTGAILGSAHNLTETTNDPAGHAELLAIRKACAKLGSPRLPLCDLYVTLEPCPMCAQAISFARIRRLYFGAYDPKGGGVDHGPRIFNQPTCHHRPEIVGGVMEQECSEFLKKFFAERRN